MNVVHDVCIIGCGMAGTFATYRISKENKDLKILSIELGRPPAKRRAQVCGFLGLFPNSDGKLYQNDIAKVSNIVGNKNIKSANTFVNNVLKQLDDYKIIKDKSPNSSTLKKLEKAGYSIELNNHIQMYPKEIHALSRFVTNAIEKQNNVTFSFDNEVNTITKQKGIFTIHTQYGEFKAKKVLLCVGRAGWRWAKDLYSKFGIIDNNDVARFGIRIEMPSGLLKEFNKSNCSIFKGTDLEIGPLSWHGTVIPEDHVDLAISAFRSNENRWKTDKVSFSFISNRPANNDGCEQTDRIGKLTFLLANDRIIKEKVSSIISGRSKISILKEYDWLKNDLKQFAEVVPEVLTKAYFHVPTIMPLAPSINIGNNLETEVDGLYVAGESAGVTGLLSAAIMGSVAADQMCK